jgi:ribosomal-protein-alanine N-acetyltransferase
VSGAPPRFRRSLLCRDDIEAVMEVERRCFDSPWTPGQFKHELKVPFSRSFLLWDETKTPPRLAGYICRWIVGEQASILNLAVDEAYRGQGLGRQLVGLILEEAIEREAAEVTLEVREKNDAARGLYAALGFLQVGVRRDYYGKGDNAIIMTKRLLSEGRTAEGLCPNPDRGV